MKKFFYLMVGLFCMCLSSIAISQTPNTICPKPNQAIAAPSKNSAILAWTVTPATSYSVQYKIKNTATWTTVTATTTPFTLAGLATCTEYIYKVQSVCSATSSSLFSNEITFKTTGCPTCNVPIVLSTVPNPTGGQLKWRSTGATSYSIQYKTGTLGAWTTINSIPDTTYTLSNLQNCKAYIWRVKSVCSATFQSNYSPELPLVTTGCTSGCTAPVAVNAYGTANGFVATWSFSGANSYTLEYKKPADTLWTSIPGITTVNHTVANLPTCTEYLWRVKGICVGIASNYSATKAIKTGGCPAPCVAPVQIFASNIDTTKVTLNWFSSTAASAVPVPSNLQYKINGGAWITVNNVTSPYILTGLTACSTYEWKAQTVCSNSTNSSYSVASSFITKGCVIAPPCLAPTALASTVTDSTATIAWVGTATSYQLAYRVAGSSAAFTIVANAVSPKTITGLLACKEYEYKIYATCTAGTVGTVSAVKTFKTTGCAPAPCVAPVQQYATVIDSSKVILNWFSNSPTTPPSAALYNVQYKTGTGAWVTVNNVSAPYTLIGLSACKTYEWKVQTVCSATSVSAFSTAATFTTTGCPIPTPCIAPVILLSTVTNNTATLTWSGGTVGANTTLAYKIIGATTWTTVANATSPYTLTGLTPCKDYVWRIAQTCSNSTTPVYSLEKIFISACPQPCLAPTALVALADSTSAVLSWIGAAAKYNVWYKTGANANWTILNNVTSPKSISGLTKCSSYEWKVQSVCDSLNTTTSMSGFTVSQFSTIGCAPIVTCTAPTALTVSAITQQSAVLNWTSTATAFVLQYRVVGTTAWLTKTAAITRPYTLAPLEACKNYEFQIAAACVGATTLSPYSTPLSFTTTCVTTCIAATLLPATTTNSTAVISWIGTATSYNLLYKTGSATAFTTISNVTSPYTLGNLPSCKSYEYKIQSVCTGSVMTSTAATFQTIGCPIAPTTYCPMIGQSTLNGWIQSVKISDFVSISGNNLGYFAAPVQGASLNAGATVTLTMTPAYLALNPNTAMSPQAWRGWVDFNRDGDFLDAGELVFTATNSGTAVVTKSFVVPTSVTSGYTRMRIAMHVIATSSTVGAVPENCVSFDNGEVEDYTILMFSAAPNAFVDNNSVVSKATIYPNPGTDNLTIQLQAKQNVEAQIAITDLSGKCVRTSTQSISEGFNALEINNLNHFPQGMYIITVRSNEGILMTQRWVKE